MKRSERTPIPWWMLLIAGFPTGCAELHQDPSPVAASPTLAAAARLCSPNQPASSVQQVSFQMPAQGSSSRCASSPELAPFAEQRELTVDALVEQVLARNPSLAQMTAAWQAASARYPQVTSLEDPMFGATIAPGSIGSDNVD